MKIQIFSLIINKDLLQRNTFSFKSNMNEFDDRILALKQSGLHGDSNSPDSSC